MKATASQYPAVHYRSDTTT